MKRLKFLIIFLFIFLFKNYSQPANNNCLNATYLNINTFQCNQNTTNANLQTNECYISFTGATQGSVWYYFNATSPSLVLNFLQTNLTNCFPYYVLWGPYSNITAGCNTVLSPTLSCSLAGGTVLAVSQPSATIASVGNIYYNLLNGDFGESIQLNNLNTTPGNNTYLLQVINNNCGGPYSRWIQFCIGLYSVPTYTSPATAFTVSQCSNPLNINLYNGFPSNCSYNGGVYNNIDCNLISSCNASFGSNCNGSNGNDVPFIINNPVYYTFCSAVTTTYNISVSSINCLQTLAGAQGLQVGILTGVSNNLNLIQVGPNPILPATTWTSSNFTVNANQCAYIVFDGFSGDYCNFNFAINSSVCNLLNIKDFKFYGLVNKNNILLEWENSIINKNGIFNIQKSYDGIQYKNIFSIPSIYEKYTLQDTISIGQKIVYYKLNLILNNDTLFKIIDIPLSDNITSVQLLFVEDKILLINNLNSIDILIYDLYGQIVYKENFNNGIHWIENISLNTGIYIIVIMQNKNFLDKKIFYKK